MSSENTGLILTYHSISSGRSPLAISPNLFADQMEWLHRNASVVPLSEVVSLIESGQSLPERTVVLTFDDGFRDFYTQALPVLRQFKFPATVFLCTGYCDRTNRWPSQTPWVEEKPLMTWSEIAELAGQGLTLGSHTVNHPNLTEIPISSVEDELIQSKQHIEDRIGRKPDFFCYPYGRWNLAVRKAVSSHFRAACSTAAGVLESNSDPYVLPRVDVHYLRQPSRFHTLFTPGFRTYLTVRRLIRRLRNKPEGVISRV